MLVAKLADRGVIRRGAERLQIEKEVARNAGNTQCLTYPCSRWNDKVRTSPSWPHLSGRSAATMADFGLLLNHCAIEARTIARDDLKQFHG